MQLSCDRRGVVLCFHIGDKSLYFCIVPPLTVEAFLPDISYKY